MKRTNSNDKRLLPAVLIGLSVACTFSLAGTFLSAMLVGRESIGENGAAIFLMFVHLISSFLGSLIADRFSTTNKLLACSVTCLGYYLILIMAACLFFDGISGRIWVGFVPVLISFLLSMLRILKEKQHSNSGKRKKSRR